MTGRREWLHLHPVRGRGSRGLRQRQPDLCGDAVRAVHDARGHGGDGAGRDLARQGSAQHHHQR